MAEQLPKGRSAETNETRAVNPAGVYQLVRGKGDVVEVITAPGQEGAVQADALVQVGFSWTADVPSREDLLAMQNAQLAEDKAAEAAAKTE